MPTVEERLASLEARMDAMVDVRTAITDLRRDMNRRLAALDQKGDRHFAWMASTQVALLLAVVGALVGAYYR